MPKLFQNIKLQFMAIGLATVLVQSPTSWADTPKISAEDIKVLNSTYGKWVDDKGNIKLPENYRQQWSHLGSWIVSDEKAPGHGFHDVYTQPEAVEAYRKTGQFPDGTVLIKEVRKIQSGAQTTGQAQWAGDTNVWFVMVKDSKGRFQSSPNWKEGWGWALYKSKNPHLNASKGFKETCFACHAPAKKTDWVYINGYPTLKK